MTVERGPWGARRVAIVPLTLKRRQMEITLPDGRELSVAYSCPFDPVNEQLRLAAELPDPMPEALTLC